MAPITITFTSISQALDLLSTGRAFSVCGLTVQQVSREDVLVGTSLYTVEGFIDWLRR